MLKLLWRGLSRTLLVVVVLAIIAWLGLYAINRSDATLSVADLAVLADPEVDFAELTKAPAENGFLILQGIDAPALADPLEDVSQAAAFGLARLEREFERARWELEHPGDSAGMPAPLVADDPLDADAILRYEQHCRYADDDCLTRAEGLRSELLADNSTRRAAIGRYRAIAGAGHYEGSYPADVSVNLPPYRMLTATHELLLARAALETAQHNAEIADDAESQPEGIALEPLLQQLDLTAGLSQRLAGHSHALIESMIAARMMHQQLQWTSQLIAQHPQLCASPARERLEDQLGGLTVTLEPSLRFEQKVVATSLQAMLQEPSLIDTAGAGALRAGLNRYLEVGFQPARTLQAVRAGHESVIELARVPADQFDQAWSATEQQLTQEREARRAWWGLRNFMGERVLRVLDTLPYRDYLERPHDLEGHRRLVLLQLAACSEAVAPEAMPAWLAESAVELRNPWTLEPMGWADGELLFEGRQGQALNPDNPPIYRVRVAAAAP